MITGDLLARHFGGEFRWGRKDCCTAACDAFAELWGIDPMASLRGRYRTRREALALIAEHGGMGTLASELARDARLMSRAPANARAGDVALMVVDGRAALGIAVGDGFFAAKGPSGLTVLRTALTCWGPV